MSTVTKLTKRVTLIKANPNRVQQLLVNGSQQDAAEDVKHGNGFCHRVFTKLLEAEGLGTMRRWYITLYEQAAGALLVQVPGGKPEEAPLFTYREIRALYGWIRDAVETNEWIAARNARFQEQDPVWQYIILAVPGTDQGQLWRAHDEEQLNAQLKFIEPIAIFTLESAPQSRHSRAKASASLE